MQITKTKLHRLLLRYRLVDYPSCAAGEIENLLFEIIRARGSLPPRFLGSLELEMILYPGRFRKSRCELPEPWQAIKERKGPK